MTETTMPVVPRMAPAATPTPCEISSLPEAARALRMMDRELAQLRREHQQLLARREQEVASARLTSLVGMALGSCGLGLALVAIFSRG